MNNLEVGPHEREAIAFVKGRGVEYDSEEHTPSPHSSPIVINDSPEVITPAMEALRSSYRVTLDHLQHTSDANSHPVYPVVSASVYVRSQRCWRPIRRYVETVNRLFGAMTEKSKPIPYINVEL